MQEIGSTRFFRIGAIGLSLAGMMLLNGCDGSGGKGETGTVVNKAAEDPLKRAQESANFGKPQGNPGQP